MCEIATLLHEWRQLGVYVLGGIFKFVEPYSLDSALDALLGNPQEGQK